MEKEEILRIFKDRELNCKNNNYIFSNMNNFDLLKGIPDFCFVTLSDNYLDIGFAKNVLIDLNMVPINDILTYTLEELKETKLLGTFFEYKLDFSNKFDLIKFKNTLSNYRRIVQMIFYNIENLSLEEQMLFNELYYYNCIYYNANTFIKDENFQTYFLGTKRVLDDRENYTKVKMINR